MFRKVVAFCSILPWAMAEDLSINDKIYDLEAQLEILKSEVATTKEQASQEKANAFNPSISVVGDILGQYSFNRAKITHDHDHHGHEHHDHDHDHGPSNGFGVREIELELRGEVPLAEGLITVGISPDHVHVEEANIRFKGLPILGYSPFGMMIKVGRFKPAIGRLNRVHLHNAPQIYYPQSLRTFLGDEGYNSQGVSLNLSFNPSTKSALNVFAEGLFSSRLPVQGNDAQNMASGLLHLWWHQEFTISQFLDVGLSGLFGRKGKEGSGLFNLFGADVHYSYLPEGYGQDPLFLLGSEIYAANSPKGSWPVGFYAWSQARIFDSAFFGLLYDLSPKKEDLKHYQHSIGGFLTHYTSEFLRLRLGYEHVMPELNSLKGEERLMLSMIFILGSHPVEPYFINR